MSAETNRPEPQAGREDTGIEPLSPSSLLTSETAKPIGRTRRNGGSYEVSDRRLGCFHFDCGSDYNHGVSLHLRRILSAPVAIGRLSDSLDKAALLFVSSRIVVVCSRGNSGEFYRGAPPPVTPLTWNSPMGPKSAVEYAM